MHNNLIDIQFNTLNLEKDKTTFFPGRTWLYFNIYSNQNCIDRLIMDIAYIVSNFDDKLLYFFTRYADEKGDHLRFRVQVGVLDHHQLLDILNKYFYSSPYILNVNIDTYQREIFRYGWPTIIDVERLFHIDSKLVSCLLSQGKLANDIDRIAFCIFNLDHYLSCFSLTEKEKLSFVKVAKEDFFSEFNVGESTKKGMNRLYQKYLKDKAKQIVSLTLEGNEELVNERKKICHNLISTYSFGKRYNNFIWSILHMLCNKIFSRQYRVYEMIGYDYFEKQLKEQVYRSKVY